MLVAAGILMGVRVEPGGEECQTDLLRLEVVGRRSGSVSELYPLRRSEAMARWREFLPQVPAYAAARNGVGREHGAVSRLSGAIRFGVLTPEELVGEAVLAHGFGRAEKWVQELCWRDYWQSWLRQRPGVWTAWRRRVRRLEMVGDAGMLARAEAVAEGRSGVAVMDGFARELRESGYLHNHARMWWAAFWVHTEQLPWELGAAFFFRHLRDADPASNTLSWRWVAGLQTPGKHYLARRRNLEQWCAPELIADDAGLERLEGESVAGVAEDAVEDLERVALPDDPTEWDGDEGRMGIWMHPDDCCLERSPLAGARPVAVAACFPVRCGEMYGLSPMRVAAVRVVLDDGLGRAAEHFGCGVERLEAEEVAGALREWAVRERLDVVVAMRPATGPVADALPAIGRELAAAGVRLRFLQRPWKAAIHGFATAGFFPFWKRASGWLGGGATASTNEI